MSIVLADNSSILEDSEGGIYEKRLANTIHRIIKFGIPPSAIADVPY